jgi:hypothetical protein
VLWTACQQAAPSCCHSASDCSQVQRSSLRVPHPPKRGTSNKPTETIALVGHFLDTELPATGSVAVSAELSVNDQVAIFATNKYIALQRPVIPDKCSELRSREANGTGEAARDSSAISAGVPSGGEEAFMEEIPSRSLIQSDPQGRLSSFEYQ